MIIKDQRTGLVTFTKNNKLRVKLDIVDASLLLPENASKVDILKYALCEKFVIYILENNISQSNLAKKLDMDTARLNEIVKYKIHLFTIDKLVEFTERLDPNLKITVL
jgi:predicted XRE-type DNA-binding protein